MKKMVIAVLVVLIILGGLVIFDTIRIDNYKSQAKVIRVSFIVNSDKDLSLASNKNDDNQALKEDIYQKYQQNLAVAKSLDSQNTSSRYLLPWNRSEASEIQKNTNKMSQAVVYYGANIAITKAIILHDKLVASIQANASTLNTGNFNILLIQESNFLKLSSDEEEINGVLKQLAKLVTGVDISYPIYVSDIAHQYFSTITSNIASYKQNKAINQSEVNDLSVKFNKTDYNQYNQAMTNLVNTSFDSVYKPYLSLVGEVTDFSDKL
ncbi:hypothetical protein H0W80_02265 [Candidatus Saccharibacteria bacterium]|nr:hypothetical protein [Candidatus Saccharibacteria bacterium]